MKTRKNLCIVFLFGIVFVETDPINMKVTIDTMHLYIKTPMKEMEPGMENVIGKSLEMKLSALGKESGFEGAKEITYAIGPEHWYHLREGPHPGG
ncbi:MAG: hypothetical protein ISS19_08080 [Bacteroidales bacterium]|nr:hypothetical protein [Bacteroidales bacterium]